MSSLLVSVWAFSNGFRLISRTANDDDPSYAPRRQAVNFIICNLNLFQKICELNLAEMLWLFARIIDKKFLNLCYIRYKEHKQANRAAQAFWGFAPDPKVYRIGDNDKVTASSKWCVLAVIIVTDMVLRLLLSIALFPNQHLYFIAQRNICHEKDHCHCSLNIVPPSPTEFVFPANRVA